MTGLTDRQIRERLVARGADALTDAELLSLVIGDGSASGETIDLAEDILSRGTLTEISKIPFRGLRMIGGMGVRRAAALSASFELGRRVRTLEASNMDVIRGSEDVGRIFGPMLAPLGHEEFWVAYLNSAHRILDKMRASQGGVSGTVVDHKIVVKRAVELLATAIVIVHNHPSGVAEPSGEDIALTNKLFTAASLFDIQLLDHLIITSGSPFSFRAAGLIE